MHELERHRSRSAGYTLQVWRVERPEELEVVQRLRHRIYVDELGILDRGHPFVQDGRLVDPYDPRSTHILVTVDGEPAGTVRVTHAASGSMELDEHVDVEAHLYAGARPAELTRYMVSRRWRGSLVGPIALYGAFLDLIHQDATHLVAAAKLGSLGRYYRFAGMKILHPEPFVYELTGGHYQLGAIHLGKLGTLNRRRILASYTLLRKLTTGSEAVAHYVFRRRRKALSTADPASPGRTPESAVGGST